MKPVTRLLVAISSLLVVTGCVNLGSVFRSPGQKGVEQAALPANAIPVSYPVQEGLSVQVTFENQKAMDATQVGLILLSKSRGQQTAVSVEAPEFFPEYFAMVNLDIEDGLLFVSESEARHFARAAYKGYQSGVVPPEYFEDMRQPKVLQDILPPQQQ